MEYKITLTLRARQDLAFIWLYLRKEAPEAATPYCAELLKTASKLRTFPAGYPHLWSKPNVHQLTSGNYSIVYGIDTDKREVKIFRFWHGAQSPRRFRLQESAPTYSGKIVESPAVDIDPSIEATRLETIAHRRAQGAEAVPGDEVISRARTVLQK